MATLATLLALELPFTELLQRLRRTGPRCRGRSGWAVSSGQPLAVVDYAHTPHALEQVLNALREHDGGRLCVFGWVAATATR
ncbi:MAG: cyanophycin synthetase [Candidatus Competibacteraceae bacterium]